MIHLAAQREIGKSPKWTTLLPTMGLRIMKTQRIKKKKRKPKVIRKKAGKLADLPSLPLDVLFEVCYSLDRRSCRTVLIHVVDFRAPCALRPT